VETSLVASVVLGLSIPFIIGSFFVLRPQSAAVMAALGAELFLPELANFRFPSLPPLDKHNLPYVCILIGCLLRCPGRVTKLPKERWVWILALCILVGGVLTALTNRDPMPREYLSPIAGLRLSDGLFRAAYIFSMTALPFYLGFVLFKTPDDLTTLLVGFSIAGLIYIPFELWEIRMSPNLHWMVYGYVQDEFADTRRWGGYRPMVFMKHGLALARFQLMATLAPFVFGNRVRSILGIPWRFCRWVLAFVLLISKSTGAVIYFVAILPLLMWPKPRRMMRVSLVVASIVFLYPALRLAGLFPIAQVLEGANAIAGPERTESLAFRFKNEDSLLAHASKRIVYGWGPFGRDRTYDRYGRPAITDGYWIIEFGESGVFGFLSTFGLLLIPIFLASKRLGAVGSSDDQKLIAGASLILAIVVSDLLPNGLWGLYPYFVAGVLTSVTRATVIAGARGPAMAWAPLPNP